MWQHGRSFYCADRRQVPCAMFKGPKIARFSPRPARMVAPAYDSLATTAASGRMHKRATASFSRASSPPRSAGLHTRSFNLKKQVSPHLSIVSITSTATNDKWGKHTNNGQVTDSKNSFAIGWTGTYYRTTSGAWPALLPRIAVSVAHTPALSSSRRECHTP